MLKPLASRIVLKMNEVEKTTTSGIILSTKDEKGYEGEVIAVGDGEYNLLGNKLPLSIVVGDRVLIGKYAGTPYTEKDIEYLVVKESDVIGVL